MGTDTDQVPPNDGADALAYGLRWPNFYDRFWLDEAFTISAAAWDNLRAGSPHWTGVDFAKSPDTSAYFRYPLQPPASRIQRTRDPRMKLEEQIAVMQHFAKGGKVEYRHCDDPAAWGHISDPSWDWNKCEYRAERRAAEEEWVEPFVFWHAQYNKDNRQMTRKELLEVIESNMESSSKRIKLLTDALKL